MQGEWTVKATLVNAWLPGPIEAEPGLRVEPLPERGERPERPSVADPWLRHPARATDVACFRIDAPVEQVVPRANLFMEPLRLVLSLVRRTNVDCIEYAVCDAEGVQHRCESWPSLTGCAGGRKPMLLATSSGSDSAGRDGIQECLERSIPIVRQDEALLWALAMHAVALRPATEEMAFLNYWLVIEQRLTCWARDAGYAVWRAKQDWCHVTEPVVEAISEVKNANAISDEEVNRLRSGVGNANRRSPAALLKTWLKERRYDVKDWQSPGKTVATRNPLVHQAGHLPQELDTVLPYRRHLVRRIAETLLMEALGYAPESPYFVREGSESILWVPIQATGRSAVTTVAGSQA